MSLSQWALCISIVSFIPSCMLPVLQLHPSTIILLRFAALVFFLFSLIALRRRGVQIGIVVFLLLSGVLAFLLWKSEWSNVYSMGTKIPLLLLFALPIAQTLLFCAAPDERLARVVVVEFAAITVVTAICTVVGNSLYDIPSRYLATSELDDSLRRMYYGMNIGGYDFVYSLVFIVPATLMIGRNRSMFVRILAVACATLFTVCVAYAQFMYAILLLVAAVLLFMLESMRLGRMGTLLYVGIPILILMAILMAPMVLKILAEQVAPVSSTLGTRLNEMAISLSGQGLGRDASMRAENYADSINAFLENPLTGSLFSGRVEVGRHSELLDLFGGIGLFGVALFIAICACIQLTLNECEFKRPWQPSTLIVFALFAMINTVTVGQGIAVSGFLITTLIQCITPLRDMATIRVSKLETSGSLGVAR